MIPILWEVAFDKKVPLIDAYSPLFAFQQYFPDGVHPNEAGADSIASIIYKALTGPPHMLFLDTAVACTVSTGHTEVTEARYLSVCNTTHSPVLDSITVSDAEDWLVPSSANIDLNHQKIGFAVDASKAPQVVGTYLDTVTFSAANAQPSSRKVVVTLTVRQGTGVSSVRQNNLQAVATYSSKGVAGIRQTAIPIPVHGRSRIELFDLRGRSLKKMVAKGTEVHRVDLPVGSSSVYLIRMTDGISTQSMRRD
jgi:hypothetical protein